MKLSNPVAAAMIAAASLLGLTACAGTTDEGRTVGQTIDDATLTARVKTALAREPQVSALDINVDTERGVVALKGAVNSQDEVRRAVEAARRVAGVRSVDSQLTVRSSATGGR